MTKWQRKIEILKHTKKGARRQRALNQMNMTGNQWVKAQVDLGMITPKALKSLSPTPWFNPSLS